jgi:hypothetical protein
MVSVGAPGLFDVVLESLGYTYEGVDYHDCIEIDGKVYSLAFDRYENATPVFVGLARLAKGGHTIAHAACPETGYMTGAFYRWETLGNLSVADPHEPVTTLTVNGAGTLRLYIAIWI